MMSGTMKFFSLLILYCTRKVSQVLILSSKPCRLVKFSPEFGPLKASLSSKWLKYFTLLKIDLPLFYQVNYYTFFGGYKKVGILHELPCSNNALSLKIEHLLEERATQIPTKLVNQGKAHN